MLARLAQQISTLHPAIWNILWRGVYDVANDRFQRFTERDACGSMDSNNAFLIPHEEAGRYELLGSNEER
jgi:hypothetical protein